MGTFLTIRQLGCARREGLHWFCLLALAMSPGCWSPSNEIVRYAIDGEVTFNGQPIPVGEIVFEPDFAQGNRGPASSATILKSQFSIPARRGVIGGPYIVRIKGYGPPPRGNNLDENAGNELFPEHLISMEIPARSSSQKFHVPPPAK